MVLLAYLTRPGGSGQRVRRGRGQTSENARGGSVGQPTHGGQEDGEGETETGAGVRAVQQPSGDVPERRLTAEAQGDRGSRYTHRGDRERAARRQDERAGG